jgi:hypothetical protein
MPHKRARKNVKLAKGKRKGARSPEPRKVKAAARLNGATHRKAAKSNRKVATRKSETRKRRPAPKKRARPHGRPSPHSRALEAAKRAVASKKTAKKTPAKEREFQAALKRAVRAAHTEFKKTVGAQKRSLGTHKKKLSKRFKDAIRKEKRAILAPVRRQTKALRDAVEDAKREKRNVLLKRKRQLLRQKMTQRSRQAVKAALEAQSKRGRAALAKAAKIAGTKHVRDVRDALFPESMTHKKLVKHIKSNSPEWQTYVDAAEMSTKWDSRRIRDEYFSPKVRGKKR